MNLVWHGMSLIHWVRPMCTGGKDTAWILAVSWSPQSIVSVHEALSYAIATGIWMLNEPILSSPGWSSMLMVHMTRPMIMCNKDM